MTKLNPQSIQRLESIRNPISRAYDFWVDSILEGYITYYVVDALISYSEAEIKLFKGPLGRYLTSLEAWIKMFL